jgi:hypothetical protein
MKPTRLLALSQIFYRRPEWATIVGSAAGGTALSQILFMHMDAMSV